MKWLALLLVLMLVGCTVKVPPTQPEPDVVVKTTSDGFQSRQELLNFIKDYEDVGYGYYARGMPMMEMMVGDVMVDSVASAPAKIGESVDYSETNVQVAGVDEADILKTDGNYIYTVSDQTLFIIKAYPGELAEVVSTIVLEEYPQGLFVDGDKLAIFGSDYNYDIYGSGSETFTNFYIYDISDKEYPKLTKDYQFEGRYFRGRMKEGIIYLVTNSDMIYRIDYPGPIVFEDGLKTSIALPDIHILPYPYEYPMFTNIHAVDLEEEKLESTAVITERSHNLYMSEENIYTSFTDYVDEFEIEKDIVMDLTKPRLSEYELGLIKKIENTDSDILTRFEKENKIYQVYQRNLGKMSSQEQEEFYDKVEVKLKETLEQHEYFEHTIINKISVDGLDVEVETQGQVPGHLNNQFSMDENDGILRLATTIGARWSRFGENTDSENHVYTLDEDLEIIDSLTGLAEDETIFSTRFIDDRLYMVTFRQVDPFFVIDLGDPSNIEELGELKIPGFSRYLHPYDEDTIIGIGQDATETGRTTGLKISLFDVSDVTQPQEVAQYVTESRYAYSTALYEHKAFLFSKEKNLLVIPAYSYDYDEEYNGAFVFNISKDEIELRGLIDHSDGQRYGAAVERSLYIEDLLYTKSLGLLRINEISDLSSVKDVDLKYSNTDIPIY